MKFSLSAWSKGCKFTLWGFIWGDWGCPLLCAFLSQQHLFNLFFLCLQHQNICCLHFYFYTVVFLSPFLLATLQPLPNTHCWWKFTHLLGFSFCRALPAPHCSLEKRWTLRLLKTPSLFFFFSSWSKGKIDWSHLSAG